MAAKGVITPQTRLETESGQQGTTAGQVKGLNFPVLKETPIPTLVAYYNNRTKSANSLGKALISGNGKGNRAIFTGRMAMLVLAFSTVIFFSFLADNLQERSFHNFMGITVRNERALVGAGIMFWTGVVLASGIVIHISDTYHTCWVAEPAEIQRVIRLVR